MKALKETSIRKSSFEDAQEVAFVHVLAWQESYKNIIDANYLSNISFEKYSSSEGGIVIIAN